jgi:competence protein ComEC
MLNNTPQLIIFTFIFFIKILLSFDQNKSGSLEIAFFDVGQGDSIFVVTPNKRRILIDGGEGFTVSHILDSYFPLNNCHIHAVVLTHPHADHLEGLNRVMDYCRVDMVYYNSVNYDSQLYKSWKEKLIVKNVAVKDILAGDLFIVDNVTFHVVWPAEEAIKTNIDNVNNTSVVLFLDYYDFEVFLPGDAELLVLKDLYSALISNDYSFLDGDLEVYKTSHHGAENGLHMNLWKTFNPRLTVLSVGKDNKFGHPSQDMIEFFNKEKALVKRTDMDGTIKIRYNSLRNE